MTYNNIHMTFGSTTPSKTKQNSEKRSKIRHVREKKYTKMASANKRNILFMFLKTKPCLFI